MHPVTKARKPFGLFLDIMDFQCVAIDGKPYENEPFYIRLDSHGRIFKKGKDTNGVWERIPDSEISKYIREYKMGEPQGR